MLEEVDDEAFIMDDFDIVKSRMDGGKSIGKRQVDDIVGSQALGSRALRGREKSQIGDGGTASFALGSRALGGMGGFKNARQTQLGLGAKRATVTSSGSTEAGISIDPHALDEK